MASSLFKNISNAVLSPEQKAKIKGRKLDGLQTRLGYAFKNEDYLDMALCHSSFANEHGVKFSNERLEFLGDSVLGFVVARLLYKLYPEANEGELTQRRAALVCAKALVGHAERLGVPALILHGNSLRDGALPPSMGANAIEAIIGAICVDGGVAAAEQAVYHLLFGLDKNIDVLMQGTEAEG